MVEIHILNPDDFERDEIRKVKEIVELAKETINKSPSKRAYIRMSELDSIFPSKRIVDRFDESLLGNLRKYFSAFNKKYCTDGVFYYVGTVLSNSQRIIFIQEMKRTKVKFSIIDEADIDGKDYSDIDTVGGVPVDEEIKRLKDKRSSEENT